MSHAYSGGSLVEQPAIQFFAEMGWQAVSALEEVFGVRGRLDHETKDNLSEAKLLTSFHCFTRDLPLPRLLSRTIAV